MKKIVSLVLAVVLAFGMASVAFAGDITTGNTSASPIVKTWNYTAGDSTSTTISLDATDLTGTAFDNTTNATLNATLGGGSGLTVTSAAITGTGTGTGIDIAVASDNSLSAGPYTADIEVRSGGGDTGTGVIYVQVNVTVDPAPILSNFGTGSLPASVAGNDPTVNKGSAFSVTANLTGMTGTVGGALDATVTTPAGSGLVAGNITATLANNGTIKLDIASNANLTVGGPYSVVVQVAEKDSSTRNLNVTFDLTVLDAPSTVASGWKIVGVVGNTWPVSVPDTIRPDSAIEIELKTDMFLWSDGTAATANGVLASATSFPNSPVSNSVLSRSKVTIQRSISKGSNVLDGISFTSGSASKLKIEWVEYFVSTKEQDVDITIYLRIDGTRAPNFEINISGTMENETTEVNKEDDYVDLDKNIVADCNESASKVEVHGGNGVYAVRSMVRNQKYYFNVTQEVTAADETIMAKYPSIDAVYAVRQVNMQLSGNYIYFDQDEVGGDYYVYNAAGEYIGTSKEALPFSAKYYLSTERITMSGTDSSSEAPSEAPSAVDPGQPTPGGDDNANANPGTGVNGFVNIAIVAGVVALAAAGAVSLKK